MTNLTVAHIIVRRHSYSRTMCTNGAERRNLLELIQCRRCGLGNHIAEHFRGFTYAVHDDKNNLFIHSIESSLQNIQMCLILPQSVHQMGACAMSAAL